MRVAAAGGGGNMINTFVVKDGTEARAHPLYKSGLCASSVKLMIRKYCVDSVDSSASKNAECISASRAR